MFVGRKKELAQLESYYKDDQFHLMIMYGRRRVGKTFLLKKWMEDKQGIYFAAEQQNQVVLLKKFSDAILHAYPSGYMTAFADFAQAFSYLAEKAAGQPLIVVIDEVQFLAMQDQGFLSMLQNMIDHTLLSTKMKLVLCGSYVSFMESELLGHQSPIFGRRTASFKIEPFTFSESRELLGDSSSLFAFQAWSILGGMPLYLKQFNASKTLRENIIERILDKGTMLHNEPLFALKQELKEPALYFSIIEAISSGRSKYNEIRTYIGAEAGYYLNTLIDLGIVMKLIPVGEKSTSRKSIYKVADPFFSFWFRYVSRGYSLVEMEKQELLYDELIQGDLDAFLGLRFEDYCIEFLKENNGSSQLPFTFTEIGKWWGSNPETKSQDEIDIVAMGRGKKVLIAECKWRNEAADLKAMEVLSARSRLFNSYDRHLMFFSKSGYTESALFYAQENGIRLLQFEELF